MGRNGNGVQAGLGHERLTSHQRAELGGSIRRWGVRRVAKALGLSGEATLAVAVDVARAGTEALAAMRIREVERLDEEGTGDE